MKIGKIVNQEKSNSENGIIDIEIDTTKVVAGLTFTGLVGGLITFITFWLITYPQNKQLIDFENDIDNFRYMNFVLRNSNDTVRMQSFQLLIEAGILEDPKGDLKRFVHNNNLPDWSDYENFIQLSSEDNAITSSSTKKTNSDDNSSKSNSANGSSVGDMLKKD